MSESLPDALRRDIEGQRQFIAELEETAELLGKGTADDDPGLRISKAMAQNSIRLAEDALASGDVVQMVRAGVVLGISREQT